MGAVSLSTKPSVTPAVDEHRYRLLVDAVIDYAIYLMTPEGRVATWNPGAERIKGYRADEIIGQHFSQFFPEEDRIDGKPARILDTATKDGRVEDEGWRVRKDGTRFWALAVVDAVKSETGEVIGFAKITRDMTERRETLDRLEETREQLFQSQKLESIGQLTGGIAHDFNNLLTVILAGTDMAERAIDNRERLTWLLGNIRHAAKRAEELTKQLLAFSRRQSLKPQLVELPAMLRDVVDNLLRSLRGDINVVTEFAADLWPVEVDPSQLELAILNVGVNARDAMPRGGKLTVSARNLAVTDGTVITAGNYVAIGIKDTGTGIPPEVKTRIFEPFFTTKGVGRGTGLGLSQAYGFARQSGGTLTVESTVGQGSTFTFFLPAAASLASTGMKSGAATTNTVLIVEDDPAIAEMAVALLEDAGYAAVVTPDASDVLEILGKRKIDLVFSDIVMPGGVDGLDLAEAIRKKLPALPVLLATGYTEALARRADDTFAVIAKPYDRATLLDAVSRLLSDGKAAAGAAANATGGD